MYRISIVSAIAYLSAWTRAALPEFGRWYVVLAYPEGAGSFTVGMDHNLLRRLIGGKSLARLLKKKLCFEVYLIHLLTPAHQAYESQCNTPNVNVGL